MPQYHVHGNLDLETRKRRLKFRAWHRGIKELDLLFGTYVDTHIDSFDHPDCAWFEKLFEENDQLVLTWVTGKGDIPAHYNTPHMTGVMSQDGRSLKTR